jgi:hypothetical protein
MGRPRGTGEAREAHTHVAASASPRTEAVARPDNCSGEVATIDRDKNRVTVKTGDGNYDVDLPASTVSNMREGDRVELTVRPIR